uniref:Uncharacterized protein n=1 Tax=Arundo donax TaxID=35708 RepID=A0A0A9GZR5_ARUDO
MKDKFPIRSWTSSSTNSTVPPSSPSWTCARGTTKCGCIRTTSARRPSAPRRPIRVRRHAVRPHQRPGHVPSVDERCAATIPA